MSSTKFKKLMLQTAFSCMACDGDIDDREINLIREFEEKYHFFQLQDINKELNLFIEEINKKGFGFLKNYLSVLEQSNLSRNDEISIVRAAIKMIKADDEIKYSEIRFFKILRLKLNVSNDIIINELQNEVEDIEEYLEQDIISQSYLAKIQDDFFSTSSLPKFDSININDNIINKI